MRKINQKKLDLLKINSKIDKLKKVKQPSEKQLKERAKLYAMQCNLELDINKLEEIDKNYLKHNGWKGV